MRKKIMLIGVGWEQLPLVHKAKEKGLFVIATTSWSGNIPADKLYHTDSRDLEALEQIFLRERPDAVLADECDYSMYAVAYLTEKYKLPGPSLEALTITNNKHLQRQYADKCGVLQPDYQLCWSCKQASAFADRISYPIIVKPVDNRGSIGVSIVNSVEELPAAWYEAVKNSHSRLCLAENFIAGDVVTVDGYCAGDAFQFLSASTKDTYPGKPTVAKALYYPGLLSASQMKSLEEKAKTIIHEIGIDFGFVHIEFILERDSGKFQFLEIANRGGGVFISNIVLPYITGVDLVNYYIDQSFGADVKFSCSSSHKAFMFFLSPGGNEDAQDVLKREADNILAAHINTLGKQSDVKDASDRIGVVILKGINFGHMKRFAYALEEKIGFTKNEYVYFK